MYRFFLFALITAAISCNSASDKRDRISANQKKILAARLKDPFAFGTYCNERFAYCIGYPIFILFPQPESGSMDGRTFTNKEGEEILRVFGKHLPYNNNKPPGLLEQYNADLKQIETTALSGSITITNKQVAARYYIISGHTETRMFYQKAVLKNNSIAYAIFQYNISEKSIYENVSGKIISSFN